MKIVICGKGGSGKSTLTALLARALKSRGKTVLVVDADESNLCLHRLLGAKLPDILMDAIWPDSSPDAALKRFKVTLHRLRKILEPDMDPHAGSSFIALKDSLISLDMQCCRVDVNAFLTACDEIRQLKRDDDYNRLLLACQKALNFYGGDFLPEEPYLSWAEMKRSALKSQYIAVLMEMAGLVERIADAAG